MEESFVPPNILYLDGITMKDYESMEDIFHKQLMERCHNEQILIPEMNNMMLFLKYLHALTHGKKDKSQMLDV